MKTDVLSAIVTAAAIVALGRRAGAASSCAASDANLLYRRDVLCSSIGGFPSCKHVKAEGDWPNQAIYMHDLLYAVVKSQACLNTTVAKGVVSWLENNTSVVNPWWNTWVVFQVQYFDMPRKAGARIESPATLGRKCWAFAYLNQVWTSGLHDELLNAVEKSGLSLELFAKAYDEAVGFTMPLCPRVMANCFVNATFNPSRNGTCPHLLQQFYVGFEWENGNNNIQERNDSVTFPFPLEQGRWRDDMRFAVNTALNYII